MKISTSTAAVFAALLSATAPAQIVDPSDYRSANIDLLLSDDDSSVPDTAQLFNTYDNPFQALDESLYLELRSPISGVVSAQMSYTSLINATSIRSSADIIASVDVGPALPFVNAAFNNQLRFDLDRTTEFLLDASFQTSGPISGSILAIRQLADDPGNNHEPIDLLDLRFISRSGEVSQNISLAPGSYEFVVVTWASTSNLVGYDTEIATSSHTVDFSVVPAPGAWTPLLLALAPASRRRR